MSIVALFRSVDGDHSTDWYVPDTDPLSCTGLPIMVTLSGPAFAIAVEKTFTCTVAVSAHPLLNVAVTV